MNPEKVFIAGDHRGFKLKQKLLEVFPNFIDLGPSEYNKDDDYNDYAVKVSKSVLENPNSFGVLLCGSAIGISMQANRFKGIRAAIVDDEGIARLSREHNNANIICLSADRIGDDPEKFKKALECMNIFLHTPFPAEERHVRRIEKLDSIIGEN